MRRLWPWVALAGLSFGAVPAFGSALQCEEAIRKVEKQLRIPPRLLLAVALTETGALEAGRLRPHPWAVGLNGSGRFFASQKDAILYTQQRLLEGETNVDVGCLQINLGYHRGAFKSLSQAFDPWANTLYAGHLLRTAFERTHSWRTAIRRYHSGSNRLGQPYFLRVMRLYSHMHGEIQVGSAKAPKRFMLSRLETAGKKALFAPPPPQEQPPPVLPGRSSQHERLKKNFQNRQPAARRRRIQNYSSRSA